MSFKGFEVLAWLEAVESRPYTVIGALSKDEVRSFAISCRVCGALALRRCRSPHGRPRWKPHGERVSTIRLISWKG